MATPDGRRRSTRQVEKRTRDEESNDDEVEDLDESFLSSYDACESASAAALTPPTSTGSVLKRARVGLSPGTWENALEMAHKGAVHLLHPLPYTWFPTSNHSSNEYRYRLCSTTHVRGAGVHQCCCIENNQAFGCMHDVYSRSSSSTPLSTKFMILQPELPMSRRTNACNSHGLLNVCHCVHTLCVLTDR